LLIGPAITVDAQPSDAADRLTACSRPSFRAR
jgi:hypothetical protein